MSKTPNILYLHCHDAGRAISPYGHQAETPALEKLAREGALFRNAHCIAPTCSPSRAALLTGKYPHQVGMLGLAHHGWGLYDYEEHLANFLKKEGYETALCGIQHEINHYHSTPGLGIGYDEEITPPNESYSLPEQDARIAEAAASWIESRDSNSSPFFLATGFFMPHRPFFDSDPQKKYQDPKYVSVPSHFPDCERTRQDIADYNACVAHMDKCVASVLEALDRSPHKDNTIVIATTDHGIAFPKMKCNLTDSGTGVFLIMRGPGITPGTITDAMVTHADVFPTICQSIGAAQPKALVGKSLHPILNDPKLEIHKEVFSQVSFHSCYQPMRSIRTPRYKFIQHFNPQQRTTCVENCDASLTKDVLVENGWADMFLKSEELYDLKLDPEEANNLSEDPGYSGIKIDLQDRLLDWMKNNSDPLLHGPIGKPQYVIETTVQSLQRQKKNRRLRAAKADSVSIK